MARSSPSRRKSPKPRRKKQTKFRLLFDENFSPKPLKRLKKAGHNIKYAGTPQRRQSLTDRQVFDWACEEKRLIVTRNTKDFRRFMQMRKATATGILSLSPNLKPQEIDKLLTNFLAKSSENKLYGEITTIRKQR